MRSKAEMIRTKLAGKRVVDIGGVGYGGFGGYELELRDAWKVAATRTVIDYIDGADIKVDLNDALPLLDWECYEVATVFDVLDHIDNPLAVLKWIRTPHLWVSQGNVDSPFFRILENKQDQHLFNWRRKSMIRLLARAGWDLEEQYHTFGKWSLLSRIINIFGSLVPRWTATSIMYVCKRRT